MGRKESNQTKKVCFHTSSVTVTFKAIEIRRQYSQVFFVSLWLYLLFPHIKRFLILFCSVKKIKQLPVRDLILDSRTSNIM